MCISLDTILGIITNGALVIATIAAIWYGRKSTKEQIKQNGIAVQKQIEENNIAVQKQIEESQISLEKQFLFEKKINKYERLLSSYSDLHSLFSNIVFSLIEYKRNKGETTSDEDLLDLLENFYQIKSEAEIIFSDVEEIKNSLETISPENKNIDVYKFLEQLQSNLQGLLKRMKKYILSFKEENGF